MKKSKNIAIIGTGRVGSAVAFALLFSKAKINGIFLDDDNIRKKEGEFRDLGHASILLKKKNIVFRLNNANRSSMDAFIICAGYARSSSKDNMDSLYRKNLSVVQNILDKLNVKERQKVFIVTNPADRLAKFFSISIIPCGSLLDAARYNSDGKDGGYILDRKGYTNWGIAAEVLKRIERI